MGADVGVACGFLALEQHHRFASDGFVMVDWKHIVGPKLGLVSGKLPSFEGRLEAVEVVHFSVPR
jgi:hypothetical protein